MLGISKKQAANRALYDKRLNTIKALHTPSSSRSVARWFMGMLLLMIIVLFLPWQQNIRATGELTALSPKDRPQEIPTPIDGRIQQWHVQEGQLVDSGQVLVTIGEIKDKYIDPQLLQRLEEQIQAKVQSIDAKKEKVKAKDQQLQALRQGLALKLDQINNKIQQYELKVESDSNDWVASQIDLQNFRRQYQASQVLFDSGLIAMTKLEAAKSKFQQSQAKQISAQNKFYSTKAELQNTLISKSTTRAEALDKISKTNSEKSAALAEIADSQSSLAKERNNLSNMQVRAGMRSIRASQKGYVVRVLRTGIGENVKIGEPLLTLMPKNPQLAVALYVQPMNVPLLDIGRNVRLQFDGWPAIQFSGWPSVSVGTFAGKLKVVDTVIDKNGKYRILVVPDVEAKNEEPWPKELRVGSGVYGWVLLDHVPIWYELWRQLNGFPPTVRQDLQLGEDSGKSGKKDKKK
ncbi:HlyD family secretion protein [Algivirga pacifica]|uniref:Biotin/lipoyl-binding protein n=1 Tax=Algivirga pacifica TaxID=1162670 RepID=A0ABP9DJI4_9BACT